MNLREYSRSRKQRGLPGGTHTAVRKAIITGRIRDSVTVTRKGSRTTVEIDAAAADAEWDKNTDVTQSRPPEIAAGPADVGFAGGDQRPGDPRDGASQELQQRIRQAQAIRLTFQAKLAQLEFEQASGKVVLADVVRSEQYRVARMVRDAIRGIPDRIAAQLAAETDPHRVRLLLLGGIDLALAKLSDEIRDGAPA